MARPGKWWLCMMLLVVRLLPPTNAGATEPVQTARTLVIQYRGQLQPFGVFAPQILTFITGMPRVDRADPSDTVFAMAAEPEQWKDARLIWVPYLPLREVIGVNPQATSVSFNEILANRKFARMLSVIARETRRGESLTTLEQEAREVNERFTALKQLFDQDLRMVPPPVEGEQEWLPILAPEGYPWPQQVAVKRTWSSFTTAIREKESAQVLAVGRQLALMLHNLNPRVYALSVRSGVDVEDHPLASSRNWEHFSLSRMFPGQSGSQ